MPKTHNTPMIVEKAPGDTVIDTPYFQVTLRDWYRDGFGIFRISFLAGKHDPITGKAIPHEDEEFVGTLHDLFRYCLKTMDQYGWD